MEREVIVLPSALRHGFCIEDIAFVVENPLGGTVLASGYRLHVGIIANVPVEILGRYSDDGYLVVFHCMKCRKKYLKFLRSDYER
jgi:hypothetical protein